MLHTVARSTSKYSAIFRTQLLNSFAYPADLFSRSVSMILFMWIFLQLWRVTYGAVGMDAIAGMTLRETMWYLMITEMVILSKPRLVNNIATAVKDGSIAYLLNKPYNFILYQASVSLGDSILRMAANALMGGAVLWLTVGAPPGPSSWLPTLVAILLAWFIDFCLSALIGLLAFITEDISAFMWIYQKMILVMGGVLIPLDFFPDWLKNIALGMPFAYTTYAPARIFISPNPGTIASLLALQTVWLLVLGGLLATLYRRAEKWLSINGG
ncbi:MAG TPA: ABC-2 family transporter protein [Anaerolineales bacterium]|nr:ABC-2 family transporter protein [Anaerolineales bacterium]